MTDDEQRIRAEQQLQEDRESIWSVPPARRALYFGLFTLYALAGTGFLVWYHVFAYTTDSWQQTTLSITQGIGIHTVGAAGLALLTIEGPNTIMVVGDYLRKRLIEPLEERRRQEAQQREKEAERRQREALEKGRAQGEAQVQAAWEAWNERRLAAEQAGQPFDEPPPKIPAEKSE